MIKKLLFLLCTLLGITQAQAVDFPEISTPEKSVWYLIQFLNQGNVLEAQGDGALVRTAAASGSDAQLWKIEGDESNGFKLTSKTNQVLYVNSASKNGKFYSGNTPSANQLFRIVSTGNASYLGGFEIQPQSNAAVSMNQFGGAGVGKELGLWDKNDGNNPLKFMSLEEYQSIGKYGIIPYPTSLKERKEGTLALNTLTAITYVPSETQDIQNTVSSFAEQLKKTSGIELALKESTGTSEAKAINLIQDESVEKEAYTLQVEDDRITLKASTGAGFFYGLQTLKQMMPREIYAQTKTENTVWEVPFLSIEDKPNVGYRGFMLDIARHFFSKEEVKRIIDLMATYKLNILHWHLTDDQGWRIEIPEYPKLTEVGSIRSGSFVSPGDGSGKFFDDTEYGRGMWYTQDDLKEIVAYAKERYIEILPEVDFPGHMVAAVTAYPELSCDPTKKYSVRLDSGVSEDVLNVGKDEVIDFLKCILDNLAGIFPYPYIHFGGDECPTTQWSTNADCLKRVQDEGLAGVQELQSWLVEELGVYVKEKYNKDIVVWDELLSHWHATNTVKPVVMAWNSINKMSEAADKGLKSIATPHSHLYLDMMQVGPGQTVVDEPYYGGWSETKVVSLETVYSLNPLSPLSGREDFALGVQANMWTETCNDSIELEYQLLPRLLALSEIAWLPNSSKDWTSFLRRLQTHTAIFEYKGLNYAKHYITPEELDENEQALKDAKEILDQAVRDGVGYPSATLHDALDAAYTQAAATPEEANIAALKEATENYKNGAIQMPQAGKVYQLISASTYYKQQYAGSSMYQDGDNIRIHYTPQTEPEELWIFEQNNDGYLMKNYGSGKQVQMNSFGSNATLGTEAGTPLRIDKATIANGSYTYIPGVVTISAVSGYSDAATGNVKRLTGTGSGFVMAKNEPKLCSASTWYLVEVTDFRKQLEGLVYKCNRIAETPLTGGYGEPTEEAITFLKNDLIAPAQAVLSGTEIISEATYKSYVALYNQFLDMPRKSLLDNISEEYYYQIQNAYFTTYYAYANVINAMPKTLSSDQKGFLWYFVKQDDGTVMIYSKVTDKPAYVSSSTEGQTIKVNNSTSGSKKWTLEEISTDQSNKGIAIIDPTGTYSWYTNPSSFSTIILKPKSWGASIWNLIKTDQKVITTGIDQIEEEQESDPVFYDLTGRRVSDPQHGIYIQKGKKVVIP